MLSKVISYINNNKLIQKQDKVLVALSGGPDSVCMLHILYKLKDIFNIELGAVHINHMLRGEESDKDEEYVIELCNELGINYYVKRIDIEYVSKNEGVSLEVAGRNERYKVFEEVRKNSGYNKVAVAHNENDQAETVIMRMMRGTGLEGLTGIKPKRKGGIIRPILCLNRNEIENYCKENNLKPRIDKSNNERVYSRNRVRLDIIPYMKEYFNEDVVETLNRMILLLQKDNEFIEEYSRRCYRKYCKIKVNELIIKSDLFKEEMDAIISRVIIIAFKNISNSHENFEMKHIYQIIQLSKKETGKKINLTNKIVCENLYGDIILKLSQIKNKYNNSNSKIIIKKEEILNNIYFGKYEVKFQIIDNNFTGKFYKNNLIKLFDYDTIERDIVIRYRENGDKIIPLGMNGSKKIKDIFIDLKIPRHYRDEIPIVCFDDEISWVIGCKTSQKFKVTKDTKRILKITVSKRR